MAAKAAAVAQKLRNDLNEVEEKLKQVRAAFAVIEQPAAKNRINLRFCVVPDQEAADGPIGATALSRGYSLLIGKINAVERGFDLVEDRPANTKDVTPPPEEREPEKPKLEEVPRKALKVEGGTNISFAFFVQPVALKRGAPGGERHLAAHAKTREGERIGMALKGGTLEITVEDHNRKRRLVLVPITNISYLHVADPDSLEEPAEETAAPK